MASVRNLKKDINNVFGDILDAVYIWEGIHPKEDHTESEKIMDDSIDSFDNLIEKVNDKTTEDRKKHLKSVRQELEEKANGLVERVNAL